MRTRDPDETELRGWITAPLVPHILGSPLWTTLREADADASQQAAADHLCTLIRQIATVDLLPLEGEARRMTHDLFGKARAVLHLTDLGALAAQVDTLGKNIEIVLRTVIGIYAARFFALKSKQRALLEAGESAGMDPFVSAIERVAPESRLVQAHYRARAVFQALIVDLDKTLAPFRGMGPARRRSRDLDAVLTTLCTVVKDFEMATAYAGRFVSPLPRTARGDPWVALTAPDNMLDRLNQAFYRVQGEKIYGDFNTHVSHDPLQARADAVSFLQHRRDGPRGDDPESRAACAQREPVDRVEVLEVGIGGGQFCADFLTAFAPLPEAPRVRYVLSDISEKMLGDAVRHIEARAAGCDVVCMPLDELENSARRYDLQRFNELFDDLPLCGLIYIDPWGRRWTAEVRGTMPQQAASPPPGGGGDALQPPALDTLSADELARIRLEARFESLDDTDFPYGDLLARLCGDARDVLFPFNVGGARFLEQCLQRASERGIVRVIDYGLRDCGAARRYETSSQAVRYFGANPTRDVLFSMLAAVAEAQGFTVTVRSLEHFMSQALELRLLAFAPLLSDEGQTLVARSTLGEDAPLPLSALRAHSNIIAQAQGCPDYASFIERLTAAGAVDLGLPPNSWPPELPLLDALAFDLAFSVSAIIRPHARQANDAGQSWIRDPAALDEIAERLVRLGYDRAFIDRMLTAPASGKFYLLECHRTA